MLATSLAEQLAPWLLVSRPAEVALVVPELILVERLLRFPDSNCAPATGCESERKGDCPSLSGP